MGNMSYCRFRNTLSDVQDCVGALEEREIGLTIEREAADKLIKEVLEFCARENIIEDYDEKRLLEVINECTDKDDM